MKIIQIGFLSLMVFGLLGCITERKGIMADLVLNHGKIWTVNPEQPWAEAVAVLGDTIVKVGTTEEVNAFVGDDTEVISLEGAFVLPGLIDCHTHFLEGGYALASVQLKDAKSKEEFTARIAEKAKELDKGEWILSGAWDQQKFDPPEMPHREWIDEVTRENPVLVVRYDGHMALANSLALKIAGITKHTATPPGGEILRDPQSGEPTGILKDAAMDLVTKRIPEASLKEKTRAVETALKHANSLGLTSIHDMAYPTQLGTHENIEIYQNLLKEGKLTARMFVYIPISDVDVYSKLSFMTPFGNNMLKIGGLKGFVDGSLGSFTALFFDPYTDDPTKSGIYAADMYPEGIMEKRIKAAEEAGLQIAIHAIGDKAIHDILDIMERAIDEGGERDRRWRIEHSQHLIAEDFDRFAKLNIIASIQPYHAIDDGRWAEKKIGKDRAQRTYAFKSFIDSGVHLACGSDWYVAPLSPILGIYAAVTRQTLDGKNPEGWFPEQKITLEEVIKGYTINAAFTEFAEDTKGSLEEGKLADMVVLSQNLFQIEPEKIKDTDVLMTVFNGRIIYRK
ncbi:amidohydrolase [Acidobacteriota bacterium]